jgi:hypothetical protein
MKGKAMNIQTLGLGRTAAISSLREKLGNVYQQLAAGDDYKKNARDLRAIQIAVVTVTTTP